MSHPRVNHPRAVLQTENTLSRNTLRGKVIGFNDRVLQFVTDHILASIVMFDMALSIPLLVLHPALNQFQSTVMVISGSWIQLWALFALQRSQNKADQARQAKADTDHEALTHIAQTVDQLAREVRRQRTGKTS